MKLFKLYKDKAYDHIYGFNFFELDSLQILSLNIDIDKEDNDLNKLIVFIRDTFDHAYPRVTNTKIALPTSIIEAFNEFQ